MQSTLTVYVAGRGARKTGKSGSEGAVPPKPSRGDTDSVRGREVSGARERLFIGVGWLRLPAIGEVTMQTRRTFLGSVGAAAALGVVGRGGLTGEAVAAENGATNINDAERSSADSAAAPDRAEKVLFWVA